MTVKGGEPPVLIIDGADFSDFDDFAREFSRLLTNYTWQGIWMPSTTCSEGIRDARERMGAEMAQL